MAKRRSLKSILVDLLIEIPLHSPFVFLSVPSVLFGVRRHLQTLDNPGK